MSATAKAEAVRKIENLAIEIGYPDDAESTGSYALSADSLIRNLIEISDRRYVETLAKLPVKVNPRSWWMPATSVNASYSQTANTLIIPAGRLHPPLFDPSASLAENYGGVGTLIGHEMAHAIDNQGRQYDATGNLRDWWTPADHTNFGRRTTVLIDQYNRFEPMPGIHVSGAATLSENVAGLTGLNVAHDALRNSLRTISRSDNVKFLESWARRWRVKYTDSLLLRVLVSDTHPPLQNRCSGPLANFEVFYLTFGDKKSSRSRISSDERISIW